MIRTRLRRLSGFPAPSRPSTVRLTLLLAVLVAAACDSATAPPPLQVPEFLVGTWNADVLEVTNSADTTQVADLIEAGASFFIRVDSSGLYTASLSIAAVPFTEVGTLEVDGSRIIFYRQSPSPDTASSTYTRLGPDRLRLEGGTRFDFDLDGTPEDGTLLTELTKDG